MRAPGEVVVDVPATPAARIRVVARRRSKENDPNDAISVVISAVPSADFRPSPREGWPTEITRLASTGSSIRFVDRHRSVSFCTTDRPVRPVTEH